MLTNAPQAREVPLTPIAPGARGGAAPMSPGATAAAGDGDRGRGSSSLFFIEFWRFDFSPRELRVLYFIFEKSILLGRTKCRVPKRRHFAERTGISEGNVSQILAKLARCRVIDLLPHECYAIRPSHALWRIRPRMDAAEEARIGALDVWLSGLDPDRDLFPEEPSIEEARRADLVSAILPTRDDLPGSREPEVVFHPAHGREDARGRDGFSGSVAVSANSRTSAPGAAAGGGAGAGGLSGPGTGEDVVSPLCPAADYGPTVPAWKAGVQALREAVAREAREVPSTPIAPGARGSVRGGSQFGNREARLPGKGGAATCFSQEFPIRELSRGPAPGPMDTGQSSRVPNLGSAPPLNSNECFTVNCSKAVTSENINAREVLSTPYAPSARGGWDRELLAEVGRAAGSDFKGWEAFWTSRVKRCPGLVEKVLGELRYAGKTGTQVNSPGRWMHDLLKRFEKAGL